MKQFFQDFKKFITRGNVIDMAIGVAVASAFTAIVTAFTKGFISPLLALITGNTSLETMVWVVKEAVLDAEGAVVTPAVEVLYGAFLQRVIDFLIIAFVLFIVLRIATGIMKRSKQLKENVIDALTDRDEKAAAAAALAEAEAKAAEEEARVKAEAEAKLKAEAEALEAAKIKANEKRCDEEVALLREIRDLLSKK